MTNFLIGRAYRDYLSAMGFCVEQVLKKAGLPEDLFARHARPVAYGRGGDHFAASSAARTRGPACGGWRSTSR